MRAVLPPRLDLVLDTSFWKHRVRGKGTFLSAGLGFRVAP